MGHIIYGAIAHSETYISNEVLNTSNTELRAFEVPQAVYENSD